MFSGIMNATRIGTVYEAGLLPFIQERFPDGNSQYQDNDPNHSSKYIEKFLGQRGGLHEHAGIFKPGAHLVS